MGYFDKLADFVRIATDEPDADVYLLLAYDADNRINARVDAAWEKGEFMREFFIADLDRTYTARGEVGYLLLTHQPPSNNVKQVAAYDSFDLWSTIEVLAWREFNLRVEDTLESWPSYRIIGQG